MRTGRPLNPPRPADLLPPEGFIPIESQRINRANVQHLMDRWMRVVDHAVETRLHGKLHHIDVLEAMEMMLRMFTAKVVLEAAEVSPTAAQVNRTAILKKFEELNDEILKLDLPKAQVN